MFGVDYAWARPGGATLKANGVEFAMRYLSPDASKNITPEEIADLQMYGTSYGLVWESFIGRPLGGYIAGQEDALEARRQANVLGFPVDRPIYFAVDWDVQPGERDQVLEYFKGILDTLGVDKTGAYGGYYTIQFLFDSGRITYGWQTYAWSNGQLDQRAQLYQYSNGEWNDTVDFNKSKADDFGQYPYIAQQPNKEEELKILPDFQNEGDDLTFTSPEVDTRGETGNYWAVCCAKKTTPLENFPFDVGVAYFIDGEIRLVSVGVINGPLQGLSWKIPEEYVGPVSVFSGNPKAKGRFIVGANYRP